MSDLGAQQPPLCNTGVKSVLVSADVDYLRLTATQSMGIEQLWELAGEVGEELVGAGDQVRDDVGLLGYRGHQVGRHLYFGQGRDGAMLQASSTAAPRLLAEGGKVEARYFKATRVDLQVTAQQDGAPGRMFFREVAEVSHAAAQHITGRRSRPWQVALRDEFGRGDTVYLGSRVSESFGRIYDKGRESPELFQLGAVRYETELKGSQALRMFNQLCGQADVASFVAGYVDGWYDARGVKLPLDVELVEQLRTIPHYTDAARQLKWLREGVAPAVGRLLAAGYREQVLAALGLLAVPAV